MAEVVSWHDPKFVGVETVFQAENRIVINFPVIRKKNACQEIRFGKPNRRSSGGTGSKRKGA
jgi:hypothetical protein